MANLYEELKMDDFKCPFCGEKHLYEDFSGPQLFKCLGYFNFDIRSCEKELKDRKYNEEEKLLAWAKLAHYIARNYLNYKRKPYEGLPPIPFKQILDTTTLPTPAEQADNLILYIADNTKYLGNDFRIAYDSSEGRQIQAWIGTVNTTNFMEILKELTNKQLLTATTPMNGEYYTSKLTIEGWNKAKELKKINRNSNQVFMAMKFEEKQMEFIKNILSPKIKELGYDLKLLSDITSTENLIDNKLRVAIKQSRLLICDLTHGNRGAYWEAGYAEGLGLPVIYICEKKVLDAKTDIHFDVSHQQIYSWEDNNNSSIQSFLEEISAKIYLITH